MRDTHTLFIGGYVLAVAAILSALKNRPRWWQRVRVRRDLRALAHYRRNLRRYSAEAERWYRAGDLTVGRDLAACAVLLDDCDEQIDRALDQLDALR